MNTALVRLGLLAIVAALHATGCAVDPTAEEPEQGTSSHSDDAASEASELTIQPCSVGVSPMETLGGVAGYPFYWYRITCRPDRTVKVRSCIERYGTDGWYNYHCGATHWVYVNPEVNDYYDEDHVPRGRYRAHLEVDGKVYRSASYDPYG